MSLLNFDSGVTLVGGGEPGAVDLQQALEFAPNLIAADGGANALEHDRPLAIIGDLDSLKNREHWERRGVAVHHIQDQNTTDLEKCLELIDAPFFLALGFLGGRLDHHLAACHALIKSRAKPVLRIGIEDVCIHCPAQFELNLPIGTRLSLFPLAPVAATSHGLRWELAGAGLLAGEKISTSNEVAGPVRIETDGPGLLLMVPAQFLGSVVSALCRSDVPARTHTTPTR